MYNLRQATASDAAAIRRLTLQVRNNPAGLDWRRFVLAVTPEEALIGCGQVKPHGDGTQELASIAVVPSWRGRGGGGAIRSARAMLARRASGSRAQAPRARAVGMRRCGRGDRR